jgi:hypothetical protein
VCFPIGTRSDHSKLLLGLSTSLRGATPVTLHKIFTYAVWSLVALDLLMTTATLNVTRAVINGQNQSCNLLLPYNRCGDHSTLVVDPNVGPGKIFKHRLRSSNIREETKQNSINITEGASNFSTVNGLILVSTFETETLQFCMTDQKRHSCRG